MKVLYAEDERQLSVAVAEILKMEGFEVTAVYDGGQALDALEKDFFDAVILPLPTAWRYCAACAKTATTPPCSC